MLRADVLLIALPDQRPTRCSSRRVSRERSALEHGRPLFVRWLVVLAAAASLRAYREDRMKRGRPGKEKRHVFLNTKGEPRRPDEIVYRSFRRGATR